MLNQTIHCGHPSHSDSARFRVGIPSFRDKRAPSSWNSGEIWASEMSAPVQCDETRDSVYSFLYAFFQLRDVLVFFSFLFILFRRSRPDAPLANPAAIFCFFSQMENGILLQPTGHPVSVVSVFFFTQPFDTSIVSCFDGPRPPAGNSRNSLIGPPTSTQEKKEEKKTAR